MACSNMPPPSHMDQSNASSVLAREFWFYLIQSLMWAPSAVGFVKDLMVFLSASGFDSFLQTATYCSYPNRMPTSTTGSAVPYNVQYSLTQ